MNIITGCLAATSGEVLIDGYDIFEQPEKAKKLIGFLPEQPPLYPDMTGEEYLKFVAEAKGVKKRDIRRQLEYVTEVAKLQDVFYRQTRYMSKGYRQRVGIAQALIGEPEIVILDEPTVGLDPRQIIEIRDLIKQLGKNHTVVLSSHILSEIKTVCSSALIISKGVMVANDTLENLEKIYAGDVSVILQVKASEVDVRRELTAMDGIMGIGIKPLRDGVLEAEIAIDKAFKNKLPEKIFYAFARLNKRSSTYRRIRRRLKTCS